MRDMEELEDIKEAEEEALAKAAKEMDELDGALGDLGLDTDIDHAGSTKSRENSVGSSRLKSSESERRETGVRGKMVKLVSVNTFGI